MSAQANIVAFDGAATPVSHTFVPVDNYRNDKDGLIAEWRESGLAVPLMAQPRIKAALKALPSGVQRVQVQVVVPVMESVSGQNAAGYTAAPKVAYENTVQFTGYFSPRATVTDRRLVKQLLTNILNNLSTTTPGISAGPAAELIDQNIQVS